MLYLMTEKLDTYLKGGTQTKSILKYTKMEPRVETISH